MQNTHLRRTPLPNGIILLSETIPHLRSVSVGVWVRTGSRYESDPALQGVSHFIEHLVFKGTRRRDAREIAFAIDRLGGHLDAFTGREYTCFYARVMDEHLPQALELLAEIVLQPAFAPREMEVERQVILEEIRTVEDSPDEYVHELFSQGIWRGHPLGQPILGTEESITRLSRRDLQQYFQAHYRPENIIIAAAGNLDYEHLKALVQQHFQKGRTTSAPGGAVPAAKLKAPVFQRHICARGKELEQVHLCLGTRGLAYSHRRRFAGYLLNTLLGSGMSSRLFQKIREEHGLAYVVYSFFSSYLDTGVFGVYAGTSPDTVRRVIELTVREFRALKQTPVGEEELKKAKDQLKGSLMLSLESTTSRMMTLAKDEMYFGRSFSMDEILDAIEAVTPEQVRELAGIIFRSDILSLSLVGPAQAIEVQERLLSC